MGIDPVVEDLEARLLKRLEKCAAAIRTDFPDVRTEVWSSPVGLRTDWRGHDVGIDCSITDVPPDQPNNVALIIAVKHLTSEPKLCGAMVVWGAPSGVIEADLLDGNRLNYSESIAQVTERLDELVEALRAALRRGEPPTPKHE